MKNASGWSSLIVVLDISLKIGIRFGYIYQRQVPTPHSHTQLLAMTFWQLVSPYLGTVDA